MPSRTSGRGAGVSAVRQVWRLGERRISFKAGRDTPARPWPDRHRFCYFPVFSVFPARGANRGGVSHNAITWYRLMTECINAS
jgi:hypothetical protein